MIALTYQITSEEPLLVTALNGDPNSGVAFPFIPGSTLRGLVAGRCVKQRPNDDLDLWARELLFDGQTRYLHAYLADDQQRRCLPVPLSWRKEKLRHIESGSIEDHACTLPDPPSFKQPVPLQGFIHLSGESVQIYHPERRIAVHTLRDRAAGRPTRERGAVYRYDALAAGQRFAGAVLCATLDAAQTLQTLLKPGRYRLGGAQTAGYGRVRLDEVTVDERWHEYEHAAHLRTVRKGEPFVVTVLSDTILRNENGATHTDLPAALGWPVRLVRAFKGATEIGGFNRKWGLPLPQYQALCAGSVFVLQATQEISADIIGKRIVSGVGERRDEGFGRLAVNWQREETLTQVPATYQQEQSVKTGTLTDDELVFVRRTVTRRWQRDLDRALVKAINDLTIYNAPQNSQLSRVRVLARSALSEGNLARLSALFGKGPQALKGNSLQQFERARIQGERLSDWIVQLAGHPEGVLAQLPLSQDDAKPLAQVKPQAGWEAQIAVRLIDGVLGKEMARRRQGGQS